MGLFGGSGQSPEEAANQQSIWNHPNQSNPYGSSQWSQGPNGQWQQNQSFNPQLAGAANSLMTQWGQNAQNGYGNGQDAFNQAFGASWDKSKQALDPIWAQREQANKSQLLNTGAELTDPGALTSQNNLSDQRGRDYQSAMTSAIGSGFGAQGQMFNENRQSWLDPLNALGTMQGMLPGQAPVSTGNAQLAQGQGQQQQADMWGGIGDLAATYSKQTGTPAGGGSGQAAPFSFGSDNGWGNSPWAGQLQLRPPGQ